MTTAKPPRLQRVWADFLHSGISLRETALYEQAYVANAYILLAVLSLGIFGLLHFYSEGNPLVGGLEIAGSSVMLLIFLSLRLTHNPHLARTGFLSTVLTMLVVMLMTGGTQQTGVFWFFIFPMAAFFLVGKRSGARWTAGLFGMIVSLVVLEHFAVIGLAYPFVTIRQLLVSLLVITIGIYVYQQSRENLERERWQSQQDLHEEKVRDATIVANIREGVVATDSRGVVQTFNHSAEELFGWSAGEIVGKRFVDMVAAVDEWNNPLATAERPLQKVLSHPMRLTTTITYRRKDGSKLPAAISARSIVVDNRIVGAVGTIRDISEELAVERAKSEFVTLASHQLRTPIAAIGWFSEMLLHGDAGKLSEEQHDYTQQIYNSNQRLAAIVEALLMASSLELGSLPIKPQPVDLPALTKKILHTVLGRLTQPKELHISEQYDQGLTKLSFDPSATRMIIQTLISNAVKYTPTDGHLTITLAHSDHSLHAGSKGSIVIEVVDTGVGIPKKEQPKVFSKLFRATNIKETDTDGTGMGLYIVKEVVEYVGGTITFSSNEHGSRFSVLLPIEGMPKRS